MSLSKRVSSAAVIGLALSTGCSPVDIPLVVPPPPGPTCEYNFRFTEFDHCMAYTGSGWDAASADYDCQNVVYSDEEFPVTFTAEAQCSDEGWVGACVFDYETENERVELYYGGDLAILSATCGSFGGVWVPEGGEVEPPVEVVLGPEIDAAMVSTTELAVNPDGCLDGTCLDPIVQAGGAITFTPNTNPTTGLVLIPGGGVDPRAYAPMASLIAEQGYLVAIIPFPGNIAIGAQQRIADYISNNTSVDWFVAGHSAGGTSAASYVFNGGTPEGLIMWSSFPANEESIAGSVIPTTSMYGTFDSTGPTEIAATAGLMPGDTRFVEVPGGNHGQFGYFGPHNGDGVATISYDEQHQMVANATVHFIKSIQSGGLQTADMRFADTAAQNDVVCQNGQRIIGDVNDTVLPNSNIQNDILTTFGDFGPSKSSVDPLASPQIVVKSFAYNVGNNTTLNAPPIFDGQVWCKMQNNESLSSNLSLAVGSTTNRCDDLNQAAFDWAKDQLTAQELADYNASGRTATFLPDAEFGTGGQWLPSSLETELVGQELRVTSTSLWTDPDGGVGGNIDGVLYCKSWSPASALAFLLDSLP